MMSAVGPYQKCQFWLDDDIKQDSHSWMSKLLLKKRKIEIGLELVIFNKKLLSSKNSTFFTSEKNSSNLKQKNSFHSPIVDLTKTNRSSEVVVGNIHRPILKLHTNPQHK